MTPTDLQGLITKMDSMLKLADESAVGGRRQLMKDMVSTFGKIKEQSLNATTPTVEKFVMDKCVYCGKDIGMRAMCPRCKKMRND